MSKQAKATAAPRLTAPRTLHEMTDVIAQQEAKLRQGGGEAGQARQRKLGRLPVRERLQLLFDENAPQIELNLWAAYEMYPDVGEVPAAGVVTTVGFVHGRLVMCVANDASVKAGAFFPATCKKVLRAQRVAIHLPRP